MQFKLSFPACPNPRMPEAGTQKIIPSLFRLAPPPACPPKPRRRRMGGVAFLYSPHPCGGDYFLLAPCTARGCLYICPRHLWAGSHFAPLLSFPRKIAPYLIGGAGTRKIILSLFRLAPPPVAGLPFYIAPTPAGRCHSRESSKSIRKCHCEAIEDGRGNLIIFAFCILIFNIIITCPNPRKPEAGTQKIIPSPFRLAPPPVAGLPFYIAVGWGLPHHYFCHPERSEGSGHRM